MAITTVDQALAGMKVPEFFAKALSGTLVAGRPWTPLYAAGYPAAAAAPAPGINGAALTSYPGQIPVPAASGNTHLARFSGASSQQGGILMLCDRLWHNSGISVTTTTAQAITPVAIPSRDKNGAALGHGVYAGLEVTTTTGAGAATPTISYTDESGNAGSSIGLADAYAAGGVVGTFFRFGLAAGDLGVRSIQSITLGTSMTAGAVSLVLFRPIASLELGTAATPAAIDAFTGGLARMYDNTVPFLLYIPQNTLTTTLTGSMICTQG